MSTAFRRIVRSASLVVAIVLCAGTDQASARSLTVNQSNHFNSGSTVSLTSRSRPTTWQNVNKSSPAAVRSFLTPYQPTNTSAGGYFPWMTQKPYGAPMQGTPAARAVCANNVAACLGAPSDIRLKTDIALLGRFDNGVGLYRFRYTGDDRVFVGVMAQEVRGVVPDAVVRGADGFLRVNYSRLGLRMQTWEEWAATNGE
jgi:hypothetical protein